MKSYASVASLLIALFCMPGLVFAYHFLIEQTPSGDFVVPRWGNVPINFRIDAGTLGGGDGRPIVEAGCDVWNNVPTALELCGNIITAQEDITADNLFNLIANDDGINDIVFDETGDIFLLLGAPSDVIGIGLTAVDSTTGAITDALLFVNGSVPHDLISTTIHELGHIWRLAHTPIGAINTISVVSGLDPIGASAIPTMFFQANPIDDAFGRTLEDDDTEAISLLYPNN